MLCVLIKEVSAFQGCPYRGWGFTVLFWPIIVHNRVRIFLTCSVYCSFSRSSIVMQSLSPSTSLTSDSSLIITEYTCSDFVNIACTKPSECVSFTFLVHVGVLG